MPHSSYAPAIPVQQILKNSFISLESCDTHLSWHENYGKNVDNGLCYSSSKFMEGQALMIPMQYVSMDFFFSFSCL